MHKIITVQPFQLAKPLTIFCVVNGTRAFQFSDLKEDVFKDVLKKFKKKGHKIAFLFVADQQRYNLI